MASNNMDFSARQMINSDITAWKIISLNNLTEVCDLFNRKTTQLTDNDRLIRDVYFANKLDIPQNPTQPTFVQYAKNIYEAGRTKQFALEKKMEEDKYLKRTLFWKNVFWLKQKTKTESQSKTIVRNTVYKIALVPVVGFITLALTMYKMTGLSKLSGSIRGRGLVIFTAGGISWVYFRLSDQVFNHIPQLPDKNLQIQRKHLLADSIITQGLFINQTQKYDEKLKQATRISSSDQMIELKRVLIQHQGFKVFG